MILNSTKFGGNRTKELEVGLERRTDGRTDGRTGQTDRQTDRQTNRFLYTSPQITFAGGIIITAYHQIIRGNR